MAYAFLGSGLYPGIHRIGIYSLYYAQGKRIIMRRIAIIGFHVCYWMMYGLLIFLFAILSAHTIHFPLKRLLIPGAFFTLPAISSFYIFYFVLFPRFLQRKRLLLLSVIAIGVSLFCAVETLTAMSLLLGSRVQVSFTMDSAGEILAMAFIAFVNGVLALVIRGFITSYGDIRVKEELRRKNTEMELTLLRSQL